MQTVRSNDMRKTDNRSERRPLHGDPPSSNNHWWWWILLLLLVNAANDN